MIVFWILLAVIVLAVVLIVRHTLRMPKKPEHEREQERLRDPAITAYKGGGGISGGC